MQNIFTDALILGLSTMVTTAVVVNILMSLQLNRSDVTIKSCPLDRSNLYLEVVSSTELVETALEWLITGVAKD